MKNLILIFIVFFSSTTLFAQTSDKYQTATLKVNGTCGMCKERIEDAAFIGGVKEADWDKHTKILSVTYRRSKTNTDEIRKAVVHAGHDTDELVASDKDYNKLEKCCRYRTETCEH